jgi:hypothetical protein
MEEGCMRFVGIDLHKRFLVVAVEAERGRPRKPRRFECRGVEGIRAFPPSQAHQRAESMNRETTTDRKVTDKFSGAGLLWYRGLELARHGFDSP